jgi:transmembrane sensor
MDHPFWKEQLQRYRTRSLTSAEEESLWDALGDPANAEDWKAIMGELFREQAPGVDYRAEDWEPVLKAVFDSDRALQPAVVRRMPVGRRFAVAAIVAGLVLGGYWLLTIYNGKEKPALVESTVPRDVSAPAANRATITLAGGRQVYLDSADNGALAEQGNAQVVKEANGQVAYKVASLTNGELLYNTLTNPRGSRIVTLTLSDGTKVWLNAESSLRYPVIFTGKDRTVEIGGEGYFEIAKRADQPFVVEVKTGAKIEVLGTSFNVNAYSEESSAQATLLEGSVRVEVDKQAVILKPGQQARVAGKLSVLSKVDTSAVMAWKNGLFAFRDADLPTVMRQLARWYNIDVSYEGHIPDENFQFNGKIGKNLSLDNVLDLLTNARVHYRIEPGNKLVIRP